jgi:hypothetical protein
MAFPPKKSTKGRPGMSKPSGNPFAKKPAGKKSMSGKGC